MRKYRQLTTAVVMSLFVAIPLSFEASGSTGLTPIVTFLLEEDEPFDPDFLYTDGEGRTIYAISHVDSQIYDFYIQFESQLGSVDQYIFERADTTVFKTVVTVDENVLNLNIETETDIGVMFGQLIAGETNFAPSLEQVLHNYSVSLRENEIRAELVDVVIPKTLLALVSEATLTGDINGNPISSDKVFIVEDDPIIGWYFNESEGDEILEYTALDGISEAGMIFISFDPHSVVLRNEDCVGTEFTFLQLESDSNGSKVRPPGAGDGDLMNFWDISNDFTACLDSDTDLSGRLFISKDAGQELLFRIDGSRITSGNSGTAIYINAVNANSRAKASIGFNAPGDDLLYACIGSFDDANGRFGDCSYRPKNRIWVADNAIGNSTLGVDLKLGTGTTFVGNLSNRITLDVRLPSNIDWCKRPTRNNSSDEDGLTVSYFLIDSSYNVFSIDDLPYQSFLDDDQIHDGIRIFIESYAQLVSLPFPQTGQRRQEVSTVAILSLADNNLPYLGGAIVDEGFAFNEDAQCQPDPLGVINRTYQFKAINNGTSHSVRVETEINPKGVRISFSNPQSI